MVRVLTFTNNKGGTGKSTLCVNLAHLTARLGTKVLLVDLTSQQTSSLLLLGLTEPLPEQETILALLKEKPDCSIEEVIFESDKGVDVIPAHVSMSSAVTRLSLMSEGKETVLHQALKPIEHQYDYIFIDSPGDLNVLTANALVPADRVLIPTRLNRTDFHCTETTLRFIRQAESYIGQRPLRVILNLLDDRYRPGGIWSHSHTGQLYQQAQQMFGEVLSPVTIPDSSDLRTAFDRGLTLIEHKPDAGVARRLHDLLHHEVTSA